MGMTIDMGFVFLELGIWIGIFADNETPTYFMLVCRDAMHFVSAL